MPGLSSALLLDALADMPFLQELQISSEPQLAASDETLLKPIRGRTDLCLQTVARLCQVSATFHRTMQLNIEADLQDVMAEGLVVDLQYRASLALKYSPLEGPDSAVEMQMGGPVWPDFGSVGY
ncbi:hypothetical protein C8R44DRAFT_884903 [Mycena epipterygia]|nr:hypothetical protein C8R44DRAFT_884903 [Mycena epipterygia]